MKSGTSSTQKLPPATVAALLRWMRHAGGRWVPSDAPLPTPNVAARVAPSGTSQGTSKGTSSQVQKSAYASAPERVAQLERLALDAQNCERCTLCSTRKNVVFGEGCKTPRMVVVGEGPGASEDSTGRPFVGPAGQLLDKMLAAIGLDRTTVYICNVIKCRPPGNRDPRPDEIGACKPYLEEQLRLLGPELVLSVGSPASRTLLQTERGITSLRGRLVTSPSGLKVLPTFHPAYLLRNPAAKREAWADLQKAASILGLVVPRPSR